MSVRFPHTTPTDRIESISMRWLGVRSCVAALLLWLPLLTGCGSQAIEAEGETPEEIAARGGVPGNKLSGETSPYLLMHATNPVHWQPWGSAAFEQAKRENKPIFLSVGYSSCYWCHVMERLVFENPEIAAYMNENFVNIKVDREERPDVDEVYMNSLIMYNRLTGNGSGGGWPLSMFLTPEGKPFAGGTYFPPKDDPNAGRTGFPTVMKGVTNLWESRPDAVRKNADVLTRETQRMSTPAVALKEPTLDRELITAAVTALSKSFDPQSGGFDFDPARPDAPKFPVPVKTSFLLQQARAINDPQLLGMVTRTLDEIARGGVRDHVGGGFHRYSTDRGWRVPHFEKMLYDQAQLVDVYLQAYQATRQDRYRRVVEETLAFVAREMTDPQGGFYTAIDAETDSVEGQYYVWSPEEVRKTLGNRDADLFIEVYGLDGPSRFEEGHVLYLPRPLGEIARDKRLPEAELARMLDGLHQRLRAVREQRKRPMTDDKVLTGWNGLMIRAYANAGRVLNNPEYLQVADRAARFVTTQLRDSRGQLYRSFRKGQTKHTAFLEDYAFLNAGLIALHEATGETQWLNAATRLTEDQIRFYADKTGGGFSFIASNGEELISPLKTAYDAVLPSGNSVSVRNLIRLASLTGETRYRDLARETLRTFVPNMKQLPRGTTNMARALSEYLTPARTSVPPSERNTTPPRNTVPERSTPPPFASEGTPSPMAPPFESEAVAQNDPPPVPDRNPIPPVRQTPPARDVPPVPEPQVPPRNTQPQNPPSARETTPPPVENVTPQPTPPPKKKSKEKVRAKAYFNVKRLPAGKTCQVLVYLAIEPGWHIKPNPTKDEYAKPTTLKVESKLGTQLLKIAYPKAKTISIDYDGDVEQTQVYQGVVAIRGLISVPDTIAGNREQLSLSVTYSACNDEGTQCLVPKTIVLQGQLQVAPVGEPIEPLNDHLFNPNRSR